MLWLLLVLLTGPVVRAEGLESRLASTVRQRYGERMPYATIVPYKKLYFGAAYNVPAEVRNSTGKKTHWAIYEYVNSRWQFIFEFDATVDADEESARLDALFSRHRFSSNMRGQLMYGEEIPLFAR